MILRNTTESVPSLSRGVFRLFWVFFFFRNQKRARTAKNIKNSSIVRTYTCIYREELQELILKWNRLFPTYGIDRCRHRRPLPLPRPNTPYISLDRRIISIISYCMTRFCWNSLAIRHEDKILLRYVYIYVSCIIWVSCRYGCINCYSVSNTGGGSLGGLKQLGILRIMQQYFELPSRLPPEVVVLHQYARMPGIVIVYQRN